MQFSYLRIEDTSGLEPLDAQPGVHPRKTVPDTLFALLFAQVASNANDTIAVAFPPLRTYAILNAESLQWKASEIEACGLPFRCLFDGDSAISHKDEAPYLLELDPASAFTRRLFTHNPRMPVEMTSVHLWRVDAAMFLRTTAPFDEVWRHFRRFSRVRNQDDKWLHFRFWDSAVFPEYWRHFSASYPRVARFFCTRDLAYSFQIHFLRTGTLTTITPHVDALISEGESIPVFRLNAEDYAFFQAQADQRLIEVIKSRLYGKLAGASEEQRSMIPAAAEGGFHYVRQRSRNALVTSGDCFTLALLAILLGEAARPVLAGPVLNEALHPIGHRVALARATYFEALETLMRRSN